MMAEEPSFHTKRNIKNKDKAGTYNILRPKNGSSIVLETTYHCGKMSTVNVIMRKKELKVKCKNEKRKYSKFNFSTRENKRTLTIVVFDQSHE